MIESINEGNKLICEFLKAKVYCSVTINTTELQLSDYTVDGEFVSEYRSKKLTTGGFENKMLLSNCCFHSSYDWLMPVCKKCIDSWGCEREHIFRELHALTDVKKLWMAIVKYIKWYNTLSTEQQDYYLQFKKLIFNLDKPMCSAPFACPFNGSCIYPNCYCKHIA